MTTTEPTTPTFGKQLAQNGDPAPYSTPEGESAKAPSILDELVQEIKREVEKPPITLAVEGRPGWGIRYSCTLEQPQLNRWRKACADKSAPEGIDDLRFCETVLANQAEVFVKDGTDAQDEDGNLINFRSKYLHNLMGIGRPLDAVKSWYVIDGHILGAAYEVLNASGYGDEAQRVDPTTER